MKHTYTLLAIILQLIMLLSSCQGNNDNNISEDLDFDIPVELETPDSGKNSSDNPTLPYDSSIDNITILAFKTDITDPSNVTKGTFLYRADVTVFALSSYVIFRAHPMEDAQTFVIIANAKDIVDATTMTVGESKLDIIQKLVVSSKTKIDSSTLTAIPMWGEIQDVTIDMRNIPLGLTCKLYRMLAKINVKVDSGIPNTDFELRSVSLYMPRQKGTIIPDNWNIYIGETEGEPTEATSTPTVPEGSLPSAQGTQYTYTTTSNSVSDIYTFEARNKGIPEVDILDRTCLVVGGWYKNDREKLYYYRIDLKVGQEQLDILRNFAYNITINSIGSRGAESADDAYTMLTDIDASVEVWNSQKNDLQIGNTKLYVSQRYPTVKRDGKTELYSGSKTLIVKASDPDGWRWKTDDVTKKTLTDFNVKTSGGNMNESVSVEWEPAQSDRDRLGEAIIVSGNLEYKVNFVIQQN